MPWRTGTGCAQTSLRENPHDPRRCFLSTRQRPGGSTLRRRNVSCTAKEGWAAVRETGSDIVPVRRIGRIGPEKTLARIPAGESDQVAIDVDGFDPSIALGTGTPSHGGFVHHEVPDLLAGRDDVVGIDLLEVAPGCDQTDGTAIAAARILPNFIGRAVHARGDVPPALRRVRPTAARRALLSSRRSEQEEHRSRDVSEIITPSRRMSPMNDPALSDFAGAAQRKGERRCARPVRASFALLRPEGGRLADH